MQTTSTSIMPIYSPPKNPMQSDEKNRDHFHFSEGPTNRFAFSRTPQTFF